MHVKRLKLFFCAIAVTFDNFIFSDVHFDGNVGVETEKYDRGLLVGKRGFSSKISVIVRGNKNGAYTDCDVYLPFQYRENFSSRWKFGAGYLKKLTKHFTFDCGCKYVFLQRLGFEHVHQWMEYSVGIRSDLLMEPRIMMFFKPKCKEWGCEFSFKYTFDLEVFDFNKSELVWDNLIGFCRVRQPYGRRGGLYNKKDHYKYIETSLLLKKSVNDNLCFYLGPTFAYNTGGTQRSTLFNCATYKSHFCGLSIKIDFKF